MSEFGFGFRMPSVMKLSSSMAQMTTSKKYKLVKGSKSPFRSLEVAETSPVPEKHITVAKKLFLPPIKGADDDTLFRKTHNRELFYESPKQPRHEEDGRVVQRSICGSVE